MALEMPTLPCHAAIKAHVLRSMRRYWPQSADPVAALAVAKSPGLVGIKIPLRLREVKLPDWAAFCAVDGILLVPQEVFPAEPHSKSIDQWRQVDWFLAAFLILEGWHERIWEARHGPIHSYSFRLKGWDQRVWERAWVNRIALLLREWAARETNIHSDVLFGSLPETDIAVTYDVDAVAKTAPIRIKQTAFNLFNAGRESVKGKFSNAASCIGQAIKFSFGRSNWWLFDQLLAAEDAANIRGVFNFHVGSWPKTLKSWLFDPSYDCGSPKLRDLIVRLQASGREIGLHPSFESWADSEKIASQKLILDEISGGVVTSCRQHWLRFSWAATWSAQERAGLQRDMTLMFNDRPGFRNGSAIDWHPLDGGPLSTLELRARPTILMDSHLHDYQRLTPAQRSELMDRLLEECRLVRGQAAVLWHPHTLSVDYGWRGSLHLLLAKLQSTRN
jgi:hypothetical protein